MFLSFVAFFGVVSSFMLVAECLRRETSRESGLSIYQRISDLIPDSSGLHVKESSLDKILNLKLLLMAIPLVRLKDDRIRKAHGQLCSLPIQIIIIGQEHSSC